MKELTELAGFVVMVAGIAWLSVPAALIVGGGVIVVVSLLGRLVAMLDRGPDE